MTEQSGNKNFLAAHIRTKNFGNPDGAVSLQVVFQERDQHSGRCDNGIVQSMCKVLLAILAVYTDLQTSGLCVAEIGAAADLKVLLLTGAPCFDVNRFDLQVSQVAGAAFQRTNRNIQRTEQVNGVLPQLVKPVMLSSGLQTTIISCFSNWWIR